jgi:cytochrome c
MKKLLFLFPLAALLSAYQPSSDPTVPAEVDALLNKYGCAACHSVSRKLVGPKWTEIAAKKYTKKRIMELVKKPEPANWPGYPPMAAQPTVPKADLDKIASWVVSIQ